MAKRKPVLVVWIDSGSAIARWEWQDERTPKKPVKIHTVGYIVTDKKKYIEVAQSMGTGGQVHAVITIPRGCILKIKSL